MFFLIFIQDSLEYLLWLLFTLVEASVICAHYNDAEVDSKVSDVDVQNELLGDAGDTDGSPGLSTVFHAWVGVYVVHEDLDILRLHLAHLLGVSKDSNRVHRTD